MSTFYKIKLPAYSYNGSNRALSLAPHHTVLYSTYCVEFC